MANLNLNGNVTMGSILAPDGSVAAIPSVELSQEDAELLRKYKTFLNKHGLAEALFCKACWNGQRHDGCEAHVTPVDILIRCRCRLRFYKGSTY